MKISIIVPVYLSEPFLEKNFINLTNQTYKNLEIIYINDGSPDSSLKMCEEFAKLDSRIKVYSQENKGAAEALNKGVEYSTGEFLMFLDADDWIELNTCEWAIDSALNHEVDMVFWPNIKEYANKSVPVIPFFDKSKEFNGEQIPFLRRRMMGIIREELKQPMQTDAFNAGWGKLYKASTIKLNDVRWTDTAYVGSSDVLFNAHLMPFIKSAYYLNEYLHHYNRNNPNSLTKSYNNTLQVKFNNLFKELRIVIKSHYSHDKEYDSFIEALNNRIALSTINIGLGYVKNGIKKSSYKLFKNLLQNNEHLSSYDKFQISYLPIHFRVFFLSIKLKQFKIAYFSMYIMHKIRLK